MRREPDYGWKAVLGAAEALMAITFAAGVALLVALILGLL